MRRLKDAKSARVPKRLLADELNLNSPFTFKRVHRICLALLAMFLTSVILAGCEKKPQELYVQVFVVTWGGNTVRLSLVQVNATPFEQAKSALEQIAASRKAQIGKIDVEIAKEEERLQGIAEQNKEELVTVNQTKAANIRELNRAIRALQTGVKAIAAAIRSEVESEGQHLTDAEFGPHQKRFEESEAEIRGLEYAAQISGLNANNAGSYAGVGDKVRTAVKDAFWEETPHERDAVLKAATDFGNAAKALGVTIKQIGRLSRRPEYFA